MRKNKVAKNVKEFLLDLIFMTAGSVIYAVGLNGFTAPNNIAPGGVSGIAIVLNYLFGTPVGTVILLINVPIIIWAIIEIGYKLVTKTMLAVVLNAACIDIVALFMPVFLPSQARGTFKIRWRSSAIGRLPSMTMPMEETVFMASSRGVIGKGRLTPVI